MGLQGLQGGKLKKLLEGLKTTSQFLYYMIF
jgi:hypothetical protein